MVVKKKRKRSQVEIGREMDGCWVSNSKIQRKKKGAKKFGKANAKNGKPSFS